MLNQSKRLQTPILGANQLQPLIHRVDLLFDIAGDGCADDVALTVHDVGAWIGEYLGDKVLIERPSGSGEMFT